MNRLTSSATFGVPDGQASLLDSLGAFEDLSDEGTVAEIGESRKPDVDAEVEVEVEEGEMAQQI